MKKILSVLLTFVLVLSAVCILPVSAQSDETSNAPSVSVYSGTPDAAFWESELAEGDKEVTVTTAEQWMQFAALTSSQNFEGWTIKLGADIVINTGDAAEWGTNAPQHQWSCSTGWGSRFCGLFDGQGHVISGLYTSRTGVAGLFGYVGKGCQIKNLSVVNSYFNGNGNGNQGARVGTFIGCFDTDGSSSGTLVCDNLYANAILVGKNAGNNHAEYFGGIIGMVLNAKSASLNRCAFEGIISTEGGYSSALVGTANACLLNMTDCYANADVTVGALKDGSVGAAMVVGFVYKTSVTVTDCFVRGSFNATRDGIAIGAAFGYTGTNSGSIDVTVTNLLMAFENKGVALRSMFGMNGGPGLTYKVQGVKYDSTLLAANGLPMTNDSCNSISGKETAVATGVATESLLGSNAGFADWVVAEGEYPMPAADLIPTIDVEHYQYPEMVEAVFAGAQTKMGTHNEKGDVYAVRFLATVDESALENSCVGFHITATWEGGSKTFDIATTTVYTKVIADGEELTASDLFGGADNEYICAVSLTNISLADYEDITFTVQTYVIPDDGAEPIWGAVSAIVFNDGVVVR